MIRLYLVDDHQIVREGLRVLLQAWGYQVVGESADLTEALSEIQLLNPTILVLDLQLGNRSGLELLAELNNRSLPTRCVILSMLAQPNIIAEAFRLGALAYVLKGSVGLELASAINAAAESRRYLSPEVGALAVQSFAQCHSVDPTAALSPRERQIIIMVVQGFSSASIGKLLHLSPKTVATYRSRLMAKLDVKDVPSLVRLAMRHNLLEDNPSLS